MAKATALYRNLDNIESYICRTLLSAFVLLLFLQIISRELFEHSLSWTEELSTYMFVWFVLFVQIAFTSVGSFPLMALPAFILAGALMEAAGISRRLVNLAESFAGPVTGGISAAAVLACMFFGAISDSGPATTAAVGMLMIPAMINRGYNMVLRPALI